MKAKNAFTLLELVFVIVVLGILAALALPRMEQGLKTQAEDTILSALRYTKHLALIDDKTDPRDPNWQRELWHIRFSSYDNANGWFYTVSSNTDQDTNVDKNETALDPNSGKLYYHLPGDDTIDESDESPDIFLTERFGINQVDFSGCDTRIGGAGTSGTVRHIAFDHLGRPHRAIYGATNDNATLMREDCEIRFDMENGESFSVVIEAMTGRVYVKGRPFS